MFNVHYKALPSVLGQRDVRDGPHGRIRLRDAVVHGLHEMRLTDYETDRLKRENSCDGAAGNTAGILYSGWT